MDGHVDQQQSGTNQEVQALLARAISISEQLAEKELSDPDGLADEFLEVFSSENIGNSQLDQINPHTASNLISNVFQNSSKKKGYNKFREKVFSSTHVVDIINFLVTRYFTLFDKNPIVKNRFINLPDELKSIVKSYSKGVDAKEA